MSKLQHPLNSLNQGHWFKLICGASYQHLPAVRNLTLAYALAGADCIDVAADSAIVSAAKEAIAAARYLACASPDINGQDFVAPWLMVSLNDGEDPHFRKAEFSSEDCPIDCPKPCEAICPAQAILFERPTDGFSGVVDALCYGCGRCLPVCPIQQISTRSYVSTPTAIAPLLKEGVDAIEIHTQIGRDKDFKRLWQGIQPQTHHLKAISISCPDGEGLINYLWSLYDIIGPLPTAALIWQTDGRPMSGDIGDGATQAAIKLSQKVLAANLPGYVQLAGGTNRYTVNKLNVLGLLPVARTAQPPSCKTPQPRTVAGVAYGSYARTLLMSLLEQLHPDSNPTLPPPQAPPYSRDQNPDVREPNHRVVSPPLSPFTQLEDVPDLLRQAVRLAQSLVFQLKGPKQGRVEIEHPRCSPTATAVSP